MKKYPLSKKAIAVALATVLAASPFLTFNDSLNSVSADNPNFQEESFSNESEAAKYLLDVFNAMETEQGTLKDMIDGMADLERSDWETIINKGNSEGNLFRELNKAIHDNTGTDLFSVINDFLGVFSETDGFEDRLKAFINEQDNRDAFNAIFDSEDIQIDDLFTGFAEIVNYLLNNDINFGDVIDLENPASMIILLEDMTKGTVFEDMRKVLSDDYNVTQVGTAESIKVLANNVDAINVVNVRNVAESLQTAARSIADPVVVPPGPGPGPGTGGGTPAPDPDPEDEAPEDEESPVEEDPVDEEDRVELDQESTTVERETDPETNVTRVRVSVNPDAVRTQLESQENVREVRLSVNREENETVEVDIPSRTVKEIAERNPSARVAIDSNDGSISVRSDQVDSDSIRQQLGVEDDDEDVNVTFSMNPSTDESNAVTNNNFTASSPVVEFSVRASRGDQTVNLNRFNRYIERTIRGTDDFDPDTSVVVRINDEGTLTAVPTRVEGNNATFRGFSNSRYVVVNNEASYTDVPADYWGTPHIKKLSNQMIFEGYEPGDFRPENNTNRAEFAALITRSLGLDTDGYDGQFTDIDGSEWYANEVAAAAEYGIVTGYTTGAFMPERDVTREEAAAMIVRAMEAIDEDYDLNVSLSASLFEDADHISEWAFIYVDELVKAGLLEGTPSNTVNPTASTKRAEVAAMLDRFLVKSGFLN